MRSLDLGFQEPPPWVIGQLEAKLTEDLRLVLWVGVLQDQRGIGELVREIRQGR
jgi:hypothetical protein